MIQTRKKSIIRVILIIFVLLVVFLFINSGTGNPMSNALAKKTAQQYINQNYSDLNLTIQHSAYNFKFSSYFVFTQSETSKDTAFSIYVDSFGNVLYDDYEYEVANNFTTFRRLDEELSQIAHEVIGGNLDYDFENISFPFIDDGDLMKLYRDMKLDIHNPPLPIKADVVLFSPDTSYEKIAEVAKALEALLLEQKIPVQEYSIQILPLSDNPENDELSSWINSTSVTNFPADRMDEENLPYSMEQFEANR